LERIVRGTIMDLDGVPIEGAYVSVGSQMASTGVDGTFRLGGLGVDAVGPITASASGYTAWSLDTDVLTSFSTRLRPRSVGAGSTGDVRVEIVLDAADPVERTIYLVVDTGVYVPVLVPPGIEELTVDVSVPLGDRRIGALGPPVSRGGRGLVAGPQALYLEGLQVTPLRLELAAVRTVSMTVAYSEPVPMDAAVTVSCDLPGRLVVGLASTVAGTTQAVIPLFDLGQRGPCDVVASYEVDGGFGPVRHVAFAQGIPWDELAGGVSLSMPPGNVFGPEVDDVIHWSALDGVAVYDVFVAPQRGVGPGDPIWSATTEDTRLALPDLPRVALAAVDERAGPLLVRVVARYAPGLDIEDNWDWAGYHGYVASPWLPLAPSATVAWTR
jgi:hypothetical protein